MQIVLLITSHRRTAPSGRSAYGAGRAVLGLFGPFSEKNNTPDNPKIWSRSISHNSKKRLYMTSITNAMFEHNASCGVKKQLGIQVAVHVAGQGTNGDSSAVQVA